MIVETVLMGFGLHEQGGIYQNKREHNEQAN
jgi:hypothetical protein